MNNQHLSLLLAVIAGITSVSAQSVIYRENFGTTTNNVSTSATAGWTIHTNYAAANTFTANGVLLGSSTSPNDLRLRNSTGAPSDLANVNAGVSGSDSLGLVEISGALGPVLFWTEEYTVDRSVFTVNSISFYQGNQSTSDITRLAIRIGSQWYASNASFTQTNTVGTLAGFAAGAELKTLIFGTAAGDWRLITFDGTSTTSATAPISVAGTTLAASLPSGSITGFGLISMTGSNNRRYDSFTINATVIPEPSAFAALAGLGALGFVALRRRSRRAQA